jgi:hypothetical protein
VLGCEGFVNFECVTHDDEDERLMDEQVFRIASVAEGEFALHLVDHTLELFALLWSTAVPQLRSTRDPTPPLTTRT